MVRLNWTPTDKQSIGSPYLPRFLAAAAAFGALSAPLGAEAIPVFAHRYGFSCQVCHSTVPQLNSFGQQFEANGFRLPSTPPRGTIPLAVKVNLAYSSDPDPSGLPKAQVDEIELLSGGHIGRDVSYF